MSEMTATRQVQTTKQRLTGRYLTFSRNYFFAATTRNPINFT